MPNGTVLIEISEGLHAKLDANEDSRDISQLMDCGFWGNLKIQK